MGVLNPLKLTITNYPENQTEQLDFEINPNEEQKRTRKINFSKHVYIDREDFSLNPPPKYFRLKKDGYVRLKSAYIVKCDDVILDDNGNVTEVLCSYVPESKSGSDTSGIKAKGVIQWVNCADAVPMEIRKYGYLLLDEQYAGQDFSERMNPESLTVYNGLVEPYVLECEDGTPFQFLRTGYFKTLDVKDKKVISEIVSLKDNFNVKK
jgi:glutaminyl-tRNA synthetase